MEVISKETGEERIPKAHSDAYVYLKRIAEELDQTYQKVVARGHTPETKADVSAHCTRKWQEAVFYAISPDGLNAPPGKVNAARYRLRKAKNLLGFLPEKS